MFRGALRWYDRDEGVGLDVEIRPSEWAPEVPINIRPVLLNAIKDSLELHPAFLLHDVRLAPIIFAD
ncbi:MAG: hypothetical protein ACREYC_14350 [Gammaproteobacteria bacterium]